MARLRYDQGVRLARGPGCHRGLVSRGPGRDHRAGELRSALFSDGGGENLPARLRWTESGFRKGRAGLPLLCRGRPDWPRHVAHAVRCRDEARRQVLCRVFRARSHHGWRSLSRHHGHVHGGWHNPSLQGAQHRACDGWIRARVLFCDVGPHVHRRRRRHGRQGWYTSPRLGIRAVPPDRDLRCGLPDHGGFPRRGGRAS
mmetsp:Transcript_10075/g.27439  ORF Transcript_10075/g.27439 Transcript_10075/m.27439 type:complete len:200 (-) Transcript_10075:2589-3188(-)